MGAVHTAAAARDVERFMATKRREGRAPKSVRSFAILAPAAAWISASSRGRSTAAHGLRSAHPRLTAYAQTPCRTPTYGTHSGTDGLWHV